MPQRCSARGALCCTPAHACEALLRPAQVGGHGEGFNPAVYTANRVANAQTREESRAKMSVGSGNILAHTVQGARVAPQQPSGSAPDYYVP